MAMNNIVDYRENAKWCVYIHTNIIDGRRYVGITGRKYPYKRWGLQGQGYKGQEFYKFIKYYGWENFSHEIVASNLTIDEAKEFEKVLIRELGTLIREHGYNLTLGGDCCCETQKRPVYQFDIYGNYINEYDSALSASDNNNVNVAGILSTCTGKYIHSGKYIWRFKEDVSDVNTFKETIDSKLYDKFYPLYKFTLDGKYVASYNDYSEAMHDSKNKNGGILPCCRGNSKYIDGYTWRFQKDVPDLEEFEKTTNIIPWKKEVVQIDYSGDIVNEFKSTGDAAKAIGCETHSIQYCCTKKTKQCYGYIWRYKKDYDRDEIINFINDAKNKKFFSKIKQIDLEGNLIGEYESVKDATEKLKIPRDGIDDCIKGLISSYRGYIWKRAL